jgi:hypothetical protein
MSKLSWIIIPVGLAIGFAFGEIVLHGILHLY